MAEHNPRLDLDSSGSLWVDPQPTDGVGLNGTPSHLYSSPRLSRSFPDYRDEKEATWLRAIRWGIVLISVVGMVALPTVLNLFGGP